MSPNEYHIYIFLVRKLINFRVAYFIISKEWIFTWCVFSHLPGAYLLRTWCVNSLVRNFYRPQKFMKNKDSEPLNVLKLQFFRPQNILEIDFTEILKFSHCRNFTLTFQKRPHNKSVFREINWDNFESIFCKTDFT